MRPWLFFSRCSSFEMCSACSAFGGGRCIAEVRLASRFLGRRRCRLWGGSRIHTFVLALQRRAPPHFAVVPPVQRRLHCNEPGDCGTGCVRSRKRGVSMICTVDAPIEPGLHGGHLLCRRLDVAHEAHVRLRASAAGVLERG